MNAAPAIHDSMRLPRGMVCADCVSVERCVALFQVTRRATICDFAPSRFKARTWTPPEPQPETTAGAK